MCSHIDDGEKERDGYVYEFVFLPLFLMLLLMMILAVVMVGNC